MASKPKQLRASAAEFVSAKGWKAGQQIGLTSVVFLMEEFARMKLAEAAQKSASILAGYDTGDDGFGVEDTIRRLAR